MNILRTYNKNVIASSCVLRHMNSCRIFHSINSITYKYSARVHMAKDELSTASPPYERVPNISQYNFNIPLKYSFND